MAARSKPNKNPLNETQKKDLKDLIARDIMPQAKTFVQFKFQLTEDDALDFQQNLYFKLHSALERDVYKKEELLDDAGAFRTNKIKSWILTMAMNNARDDYRKKYKAAKAMKRSQSQEEEELTLQFLQADQDPSTVFEPTDKEIALKAVFELAAQYLSAKERAVFEMRYKADELTKYNYIAQTLGMPLGTVKARLHRAHKVLKEHLNEKHSAAFIQELNL